MAFGLLALIQLVMAITSQNNLIYLFVFSEISVALASMFFTNFNVEKFSITGVEVGTCFAGEDNWVQISMATANEKPSYQMALRWSNSKDSIWILPSTYQTQINWKPNRRGRQRLPRLTLESSFPFGLLRAWKIEKPEQEILVYPMRKGQSTFPATSRGEQSVQQHGLFYDLRPFQRGDWPRRIDWRASQRSQQLLIRRFEEEAAIQMDFHWSQVSHLTNFEDKLSQLALWVDRAERDGALYSLEIGSWRSGRAHGPEHWNHCMEHLALLEERSLK